MRRILRRFDNERGGTIVLVAVSLTALLAVGALAVDLGLAYTARSEAQRVADAAALAGASVFMEQNGLAAQAPAVERARDYVERNVVRNRPIDVTPVGESTNGGSFIHEFADGRVEVVPTERRVRVTVRRDALPTWFARVLGVNEMRVSARAAARVQGASSAKCVKPFAVPDLWRDANDNGQYDPGEYYERYDPKEPSGSATGYGSDMPGAQYGRQVSLIVGSPHDAIVPTIVLPLQLPSDPTKPKGCKGGGGGGNSDYRTDICQCNNNEFTLGAPGQMLYTGMAKGETSHGVKALLDDDPNARWENGTVVGSKYGDFMDSPRVIKLAMFDPSQLPAIRSGFQNRIEFNNIALFFLEEPAGKGANFDGIVGRFLGYPTPGYGADGSTTGSTLMLLQLVE